MLFSNKDLKKLIIPLVVEQILSVAVGMVDTTMVSLAGEAAISGVSLVDMVVNLLNSIFAALATGGAVIVSQYIGKKKRETACEARQSAASDRHGHLDCGHGGNAALQSAASSADLRGN